MDSDPMSAGTLWPARIVSPFSSRKSCMFLLELVHESFIWVVHIAQGRPALPTYLHVHVQVHCCEVLHSVYALAS